MKALRTRTTVITACVFVAVLGAAVPTVLFVTRDRTPDPPDITAISLRDAMKFEASADYDKMSAAKRRAFSDGVLQKLQALPFEEMLRTALDPANMEMQRKRLANLRKLPNYDELHSRYAAHFLEKFYDLPALKRKVYLTALAFYQEAESRLDPGRYKLPAPGEFQANVFTLFAKQPPKMKAHALQFMIDLRQQREKLGLTDLPLPMK